MKTETFECVICMAFVAMDICLLGIQLHLSSIKKTFGKLYK